MTKNFLGTKILIITAHPDDESYLAAGSLYANYKAGGTNFLICATTGEKGMAHLKKPTTPAKLSLRRKKELKKATKILKINKLYILNFPDGEVRAQTGKLYKKILKISKKLKPDWVISFGPDGITGHYDHIAIGTAAKKIAKNLKLPLATFALPPKSARSANIWLKTRRHNKRYTKNIRFTFKPTIKIKINSKIKKQALACHASQLDDKKAFTGFPKYAVKEILSHEYFVSLLKK